jgi:hypothetical protein
VPSLRSILTGMALVKELLIRAHVLATLVWR